jgi:hypothetical protein
MKKVILAVLILLIFVPVALAAVFSDDFDGSSLSGSWAAGSWSGGGYTPTVASSIVTLPGGGWVRTNSTYTYAILEAEAEFGNGAFQHIGFASNNFDNNYYFLFSTNTGDGNLYARVSTYNAAENSANLGAIPTGLHTYRLEWLPNGTFDRMNFYIDGVFRVQANTIPVGVTNLYAYLSNNGAATLQVDSISIDDDPTATPTSTPTGTLTPTATPTATNTPSGPTPTATDTPSAPTPSPTPTPTPTFVPPPIGTPSQSELSGQIVATMQIPYDFEPLDYQGGTDPVDLAGLIGDVSFINLVGSVAVTMWSILDGFAGGGVLGYFVVILLAVVVIRWLASFVYGKPIHEEINLSGAADVVGDVDPDLGKRSRKIVSAIKNRPRF